MPSISYDSAPFEVREDLAAAHRRAWDRLAGAGTWLDGATRIMAAEEVRHARGCALCARRKAALSPYGIDGRHDDLGKLPETWVEVIHRIVSDPARLTHGWYKKVIAGGLTEGEYVEIVSVLAHVTAIDTFARGLGMPKQPLPAPKAGKPSRYRPAEARVSDAWVPTIVWSEGGANEADYFVGPSSNIRRALTLVPDEARSFFDVSSSQYLAGPQMRDFGKEYRAITHAQLEFLAARVSALNQCLYWTTRHSQLLRASSQHTGDSFDLRAVTGGAGSGDSGIPHGALLIEFAEAVLGDDDRRLAAARAAIVAAMGEAALVDAAGIAGFFNAIDRVADSTGTPLDEAVVADTEGLRAELGINDFAAAR